MRSSWSVRAAVLRTSVLWVAIAAWGEPVYAQSAEPSAKPQKSAALERARDAWSNGDFDIAPGLYLDAITAGGLQKADVVDAYTRIGCALTMAHKTQAALTVFRNTAMLDPGFKVPPEAGKKVGSLAERARREQAHFGSLTIAAQVADEVDSGTSIGVDVSVAPARNALVDAVSVEAKDNLTAHAWAQSRPLNAHLHFDVPSRLALPDASIVVVVEARDSHNNQLASIEKRVHVAPAPPPPSPSPPPFSAAISTPSSHAYHDESPPAEAHKGGFWSSAWPYLLGGVALAAGGAAVYFALRPSDDVTVGAARVNLVH